MSQSAVLVATLAAAFVLYVAASGRLSTYSAALLGPVQKPAGGKGGGGIGGDVKTAVNIGKTVGEVAAVFG